ncbi:MAG: JDVT-CTERM system glutamic-type intramembrane protease [Magnetococcus sp. WYHC-3]
MATLAVLIRDRWLWAAWLAGPLVWLLLAVVLGAPGLMGGDQAVEAWIRYLPWLVLLAVVEEALFRGVLQGWLLRCWPGILVIPGVSRANLVTSCIFVMAHLGAHGPLWAMAVFIPSLVFGFFRERHRRLATPILLHVWHNAGYFLILG